MSFDKFRIKRNRLLQQRFNLVPVQTWIFCSLPLPKTHCVVVVGMRIGRLQFRKAFEALDHLIGLAGRAVVSLREKEVTRWIGWAQIGSMKQRFDRLVIIPARVKSNSQ